MRKFSKGEEEAEVNMTPMLDIVFIMLIFFIVTASFVKESGVEVNKPEDNNNQTKNDPKDKCERAIGFQIDDANRITHNFRTIDISSVSSVIKKANVECPDAPVVFQYAEGAEFGNLIIMYDDALAVGLAEDKVIMVPKS